MKIFHVLDKIENAIYNSRKIPWTNYTIIRQDKFLNLIEKTRQSLPEDMKQARWVSKENERIMEDTHSKAGEMVEEAEKQAKEILAAAKEEGNKLLDKEPIVVKARKRADEILAETQKKADEMMAQAKAKSEHLMKRANEEADFTRKGADQYALRILSGLEGEFARILSVVKRSKEALQPPEKLSDKPEKPLEEAQQEGASKVSKTETTQMSIPKVKIDPKTGAAVLVKPDSSSAN